MISISVSGGIDTGGPTPILGGPSVVGAAAHVVSDHPLNHLVHGSTVPGSYGVSAEIDLGGLFASVPGPLSDLAAGISSIAPAFLHLHFNDAPIVPGISLQGTEINWPSLGIGQGVPGVTDSTIITAHNILNFTKGS